MFTLAVLPFPNIDPVIFSIGPFAVRWYALAYIVGLIFGIWYMKRLVSNPKLWEGTTPSATPAQIDSFFSLGRAWRGARRTGFWLPAVSMAGANAQRSA